MAKLFFNVCKITTELISAITFAFAHQENIDKVLMCQAINIIYGQKS